MTRRTYPNDFTILVAHYPHGTDPSLNNKTLGCPAQIRTTMTQGNVYVSHGEHIVGAAEGGYGPQTGVITVADNDFTKGRCVLTLGDFELVALLHWQPGGTLAASATALATAISNLPGWVGTPVGSTVEVEFFGDSISSIDFKVLHDDQAEGIVGSGVVNLTLAPDEGVLDAGLPNIGPPVIT